MRIRTTSVIANQLRLISTTRRVVYNNFLRCHGNQSGLSDKMCHRIFILINDIPKQKGPNLSKDVYHHMLQG